MAVAPASTIVVILLVPSPEIDEVPFCVKLDEVNVASRDPSSKLRTGALISLKSRLTFPIDSSQFRIPSLSKSISILSIIRSLSRSSGHILTGIICDSKVAPEHTSVPTNL